ncbi:hypothetical protein LINPERPRIM_LOCUS22804 [Linum perenne]
MRKRDGLDVKAAVSLRLLCSLLQLKVLNQTEEMDEEIEMWNHLLIKVKMLMKQNCGKFLLLQVLCLIW